MELAEALLKDRRFPIASSGTRPNQGVYRQWLRGIREATGDLVWIAEADDDCSPALLETLVPAFAASEVVLAYCQSKQIDETGTRLAPDYLAWTADIAPDEMACRPTCAAGQTRFATASSSRTPFRTSAPC